MARLRWAHCVSVNKKFSFYSMLYALCSMLFFAWSDHRPPSSTMAQSLELLQRPLSAQTLNSEDASAISWPRTIGIKECVMSNRECAPEWGIMTYKLNGPPKVFVAKLMLTQKCSTDSSVQQNSILTMLSVILGPAEPMKPVSSPLLRAPAERSILVLFKQPI